MYSFSPSPADSPAAATAAAEEPTGLAPTNSTPDKPGASGNPPPVDPAALLGLVPDGDLAQRRRLFTSTIQAEREKLRIPVFNPRFARQARRLFEGIAGLEPNQPFAVSAAPVGEIPEPLKKSPPAPGTPKALRESPELRESLGTERARVIAQRFGLKEDNIGALRRSLGIPAFDYCALPPELQNQLGTAADSRLAKQYGVPGHRVMLARKARNIPSFRQKKIVQFSEKILPHLGSDTDSALAKRLSVPKHYLIRLRKAAGVPRFKKLPKPPAAIQPLLGKLTDITIARRFGVARDQIRYYRRCLKIPAAQPRRISVPPEFSDYYKSHTIAESAAHFNISKQSAYLWRRKLCTAGTLLGPKHRPPSE